MVIDDSPPWRNKEQPFCIEGEMIYPSPGHVANQKAKSEY
jgi:hypothetical protein